MTTTRAARAAELEALHISGLAAETVLRLEAPLRHRARVEAFLSRMAEDARMAETPAACP